MLKKSPKGFIQQNITTLSIEILPPQIYNKKGKPSSLRVVTTQDPQLPRAKSYLQKGRSCLPRNRIPGRLKESLP